MYTYLVPLSGTKNYFEVHHILTFYVIKLQVGKHVIGLLVYKLLYVLIHLTLSNHKTLRQKRFNEVQYFYNVDY